MDKYTQWCPVPILSQLGQVTSWILPYKIEIFFFFFLNFFPGAYNYWLPVNLINIGALLQRGIYHSHFKFMTTPMRESACWHSCRIYCAPEFHDTYSQLKLYTFHLLWQLVPENPGRQKHSYESPEGWHTPWLRQGLGSHMKAAIKSAQVGYYRN